MIEKLWITWHVQARSRNLARELDLPIEELFITDNIFKRHLFSTFWTIGVLIKHRPKFIIIQYSYLLQLVVKLYKIFNIYKTIIVSDCHTKTLRRKVEGFLNCIFWPLKKWSFKKIDLSVITNEGMEKDIVKFTNNYILLPDKIPQIDYKEIPDLQNQKYLVNISSFAVDEPFDEIFEVANLLPKDIKLYWTGKIPKDKKMPEDIPSNIEFTGYLSFEEYHNLIGNADCILALTTEDGCLQSGAYEALAVEKPMVLSDTEALKSFFKNSAIYTEHLPEQISKAVLNAINQKDEIIKNIKEVKELRNAEFEIEIQKIRKIMNKI